MSIFDSLRSVFNRTASPSVPGSTINATYAEQNAEFTRLLESRVSKGDPYARLIANVVNSTYQEGAVNKRANGILPSTATSGTIGINDYGFKGKRQYIADRRYLVDLFVIAYNNPDVRVAMQHLRNEIFRRGIEWEPAFSFKCVQCGKEYSANEAKKLLKSQNGSDKKQGSEKPAPKDPYPRCGKCRYWRDEQGHYLDKDGRPLEHYEQDGKTYTRGVPARPPLREPDEEQKEEFERFLKEANYFGQSFESVLRECEDDLNVVDDAALFLSKEYYTADEEDGETAGETADEKKIQSFVRHIFRLDPVLLEFDLDYRGVPGMRHHACLFHRDQLLDVPPDEGWEKEWKGRCQSCGYRTYPIWWKYNEQYLAGGYGSAQTKVLYLLKDEVIHWSRYTPCFDALTETLVRGRGWVPVRDITIEDEISTVTPDGEMVWNTPRAIHTVPWDRPMWTAVGAGVDLRVTPNHKLWVASDRGGTSDEGVPMHQHDDWPLHHVAMKHEIGASWVPYDQRLGAKFQLIQADHVAAGQRLRFADTVSWSGEKRETFEIPAYHREYRSGRGHAMVRSVDAPVRAVDMGDWLEFLGYYLSEGTVVHSKGKNFQLTQCPIRHPEIRQAMKNCLDRLEIPWTETGQKITGQDVGIREYLKQFGKSCDRFVPQEFKDLDARHLRRLFDALMDGDGNFDGDGRPKGYTTISRQLADDVSEIALKLGYSVAVHHSDTRWRIRLSGGENRRSRYRVASRYGRTRERDEVVYGLEVPGHQLLVRRNGKIVRVGNTETYGYPPVLSLYEKALTLIGMDRYLYDYFYERKVPQGIIATTTDDAAGLEQRKMDVQIKMQNDPHYIPWIAVNSRTGQGRTEFVRFAYSLDELNYLPVRDEIRERISALYGVSNMWLNDTEGGGGLNNESQQLVVMSRVVEGAQRSYEVDVFEKLLDQFGITDWKLDIRTPEEINEMKEWSLKLQKAQWAGTLVGMGFGVTYDQDEDTYEITGEVLSAQDQQKQQMQAAMGGLLGGGGGGAPGGAPGGLPGGARGGLPGGNRGGDGLFQ